MIAAGSRHDTKFGQLAEQIALSAALQAARGKGIPPFLALHIFGNPDGSTHPPDDNYCTSHQTRMLATALGDVGVRCEVLGTANKSHITLDSEIGKPGDFVTASVVGFLESL